MDPMTLIGVGGGILQTALQKKKSDQLVKQQQAWLDKSETRNLKAQEEIDVRNPEADRRYQESVLRQGQANAMDYGANAAAGSNSFAGQGSNQLGQAVKGSSSIAQATAPYDQAIAGTVSQRQQVEAGMDQARQGLLDNAVNIESQRLYTDGADDGKNYLTAMLAGGTGAFNLGEMLRTGDETVDNGKLDKVPKPITKDINVPNDLGFTMPGVADWKGIQGGVVPSPKGKIKMPNQLGFAMPGLQDWRSII